MDQDLLAEGRRVARPMCHRLHLAIPSILAVDESFVLRATAFGPDGLPLTDATLHLDLTPVEGLTGLPAHLDLVDGHGRVEGLACHRAGCLRLAAICEGATVAANPAWVERDPAERLFWGDLHVHTIHGDCHPWSCRTPRFGYAFARDAALLDFAAMMDHLRGFRGRPDRWDDLQRQVSDFNAPGRFVAILGYESSHKTGLGGDHNIHLDADRAPYFWVDREDMHSNGPAVPLADLWAFCRSTGIPFFGAPHHSGRAGKYRDFTDAAYDPQAEWVFEVYSAWGSSERRQSRFPLSGGNTDRPAYLADALRAGCRYGVIASSDDHTTLPGGCESRNWGRPFAPHALGGYHQKGLAAIRAPHLDRSALFAGLRRRACYGTTFARSLLDVRLGDLAMGQEAVLGAGDPLRERRVLRVRWSGDHPGGATATLVRNGEDLTQQPLIAPSDPWAIAEIDLIDDVPLDRTAMRGAIHHPAPFTVYHVRVENGNGDTLWSSPIWLDG